MQNKKLHALAHPDAFPAWKSRAIDHLCKDRAELRKLLKWAETKTSTIPFSDLHTEAMTLGQTDIEDVNYKIWMAIKEIMDDAYIQKADTCTGQGFELWRIIHTDFDGSSAQVVSHKIQRYVCPIQCKDELQLRGVLAEWEQLGTDLQHVHKMEDVMKVELLMKLLPPALGATVRGNPSLQTYSQKLGYIKRQVEFAQGEFRHKQLAAPPGKGPAPMDMSNIVPQTPTEQFLFDTLNAFQKGKGKGGKAPPRYGDAPPPIWRLGLKRGQRHQGKRR